MHERRLERPVRIGALALPQDARVIVEAMHLDRPVGGGGAAGRSADSGNVEIAGHGLLPVGCQLVRRERGCFESAGERRANRVSRAIAIAMVVITHGRHLRR